MTAGRASRARWTDEAAWAEPATRHRFPAHMRAGRIRFEVIRRYAHLLLVEVRAGRMDLDAALTRHDRAIDTVYRIRFPARTSAP